ncbi:MAG: sigma 54-interacting transcriptional regulator [Thermoanaerobaculia bacterium]
MGDRRAPRAAGAGEATSGLDPVTGLGRSSVALVVGRSAGERESVARALHRAHRGADGPFLRVQAAQEEKLLQQALESWLGGSVQGDSPRLLNRLESGTLFVDELEALGPGTQKLLAEFLACLDDAEAVDGTDLGPMSQPWKGQLVTGSEQSLRGAVKEGRFDENLALRLERVRIVLDPEQAGLDH